MAAGVFALLTVMSISAHRLESGLRLALWPRPGSGTVSISTWIGAGSAADPTNLGGLAHLVEHMLFKGTDKRGVGEIAGEIEAAGGDINAWTTFDNIVVQLRVPPSELELGLDVAGDMLATARMDAAELELERLVVLDELNQAAADPQRTLGRGLFSTVFRRHPYRAPILGTRASLARIAQSDVLGFADRHITGENTVVSIAGDFDCNHARGVARRAFGRLQRGAPSPARTRVADQRQTRDRIIAAPVIESQLILAFPSPPLASRDHVLLDLISIALGQGSTSLLARQLEGEDELATSSGAYVHGFRDAGLFVATASSSAECTLECAEELTAHVFAQVNASIDDEVLATAKNAIVCDSVYGRETVGGLAAAAGLAWSNCGDPEDDRQRLRWARAATDADLRDVAARILQPRRATIAAMLPDDGPKHSSGHFARLVQRVGASVLAAPGEAKATPAKTKAAPATKRVVLANGLTVVVHRDDTIPLVAAQATWPGGLRIEDAKTSGLGALTAASIARGCGARTDDDVATFLDRRAMTLSGYSGRNSFGIRGEWIANGDNAPLELVLDCMQSPRFDRPVVERERRRLRDEASSRQQSPAHLAHRMFAQALYGTHPYALDALGDDESLTAMADDVEATVRNHFESHYPVSAATLAIVGDVDPDVVIAAVTARLGGIAKVAATPARPAAQAVSKERERFAYLERSRAHLIIGFPGVSQSDGDRGALEVLAAILGGQGGRLFSSLREKQGLVYRVAAHSIEGVDPGAFAVVTQASPENLEEAAAAIRVEIDRLRDELVTSEELARAVTFLAGVSTHALERRGNLAAALAYAEAHGLGFESVRLSSKALSKLKPKDIQRAARRFLRWDTSVTSTVLPPAASPAVIKRARGVRRVLRTKAARKRR